MEFEHEVETSSGKSISEYISMIKRRKNIVIIATISLFLIGLLVTLLWPATYRSEAVILIEEQDVPNELVRSTITSYAVQRIEEIKQRIMTTSNIVSIVEKFNVYSEGKLERLTRSEIASNFREKVSILPISAEVIDPTSGRPTEAVIAFRLAFNGKSSLTTQQVTNELVTLYLNENLRERAEQSTSTSEFLSNEAEALNNFLKQLEDEISIFKNDNPGSLPELNTYNLNALDRHERELTNIDSRIQDLQTRNIELSSRLSQLTPYSPTILVNGETVLNDHDRLQSLRSEFRNKSAVFKSEHPDLIKLKREISILETELGSISDYDDLSKELLSAQNSLSSTKAKYHAQHPEVSKIQNKINQIRTDLENHTPNEAKVKADNPAYVLLESQIKATESELDALNEKKLSIDKKILELEHHLLMAPTVEKKYQALLRDYENTRLKYREIQARQLEAELGKNLERERKGERFTLIQPPEVPEKPVSPNRIAIFLIFTILSVGAGVGLAFLVETIDTRLYGITTIEKASNMAPLVVIPRMSTVNQPVYNRQLIYLIAAGLIFSFILVLVVFHSLVKPLDVTWYIILRKFGLS